MKQNQHELGNKLVVAAGGAGEITRLIYLGIDAALRLDV
jgi:hypothetical protein